MKKILVTTDFSANSKAGIRFAIQLASQNKYALTFYHAYYIMKPTSWSDTAKVAYERKEADKIQQKISRFVEMVYKSVGKDSKNIKCVISSSVFTESSIREYADANKFNFICISTRGAGKLKKIFGTNTSNLINNSSIPVIAVPYNYRTSKIKSILYAADLVNIENELREVVDFSKPLNAEVELLHFNSSLDLLSDMNSIETVVKKFSKYNVKLHFENSNLVSTLFTNIEAAIQRSKPSMLIMFTQHNRSLLEKIFLSSKSAEYSFNAKVPLLVFNKTGV